MDQASDFDSLAERIRSEKDEAVVERLYWELVGLYRENIERWASSQLTQIRGGDRAPFNTMDMSSTFKGHLIPHLLKNPPELRTEGEFLAWMKRRIEWMIHDKNRPLGVHVVKRDEDEQMANIGVESPVNGSSGPVVRPAGNSGLASNIPGSGSSLSDIEGKEFLALLRKVLQPNEYAMFEERAVHGTDFLKLAEMFGIYGEDGKPSPDAVRMRFGRTVKRLQESEYLADYKIEE